MAGEVQSLLRGLALCEALADYDGNGVGLTILAKKVGLTPSTTHRLLATLVDEGYVTRSQENNNYVLGHRIIGVAASVRRRTAHIRVLAHKHLESIAQETGETVNLVVLEENRSVYIDQADGAGAFRVSLRIGSTFPAHTSASAKAILAFQASDDQVASLFLDKDLRKLTKNTIIDLATFKAQLLQVKELGYAVEEEEVETGVSCVAAPVLLNGKTAVAALSVPGPTGRILMPSAERLGRIVSQHARSLSVELDATVARKK
ncbi:Transcriptional repressor IclR [compost metagenome]